MKKMRKAIDLTLSVLAAVLAVSLIFTIPSGAITEDAQTYVDALKAENAFTKEAQLEALNKAKDTALAVLSPAAVQFIADVYGDLNAYLIAKIEETVRVQKTEQGVLLPGVLEVTE